MRDPDSRCWDPQSLVLKGKCVQDDTVLKVLNTYFLCLSIDVVPAPKNLRFSEITQTSFRATWDHGAPDVALYRIGWTKKGENNFQYVRDNQL